MMENDPNMKPMVKPTPQPIKAPILEMHISTLRVAKMGVRVLNLLHWKIQRDAPTERQINAR
jgi:hypothetical protein